MAKTWTVSLSSKFCYNGHSVVEINFEAAIKAWSDSTLNRDFHIIYTREFMSKTLCNLT